MNPVEKFFVSVVCSTAVIILLFEFHRVTSRISKPIEQNEFLYLTRILLSRGQKKGSKMSSQLAPTSFSPKFSSSVHRISGSSITHEPDADLVGFGVDGLGVGDGVSGQYRIGITRQ